MAGDHTARAGTGVGGKALEQELEVGLGELPLARGGDLLVVREGQQSGLYLSGAPKSFRVRACAG
jgi:hypothetical protein